MNCSRPSASRVTVPPVTLTDMPTEMAWPSIAVTVRRSPSTSLSLLLTSKTTAVSSAVVKLSLTATGGSLTGVTVPLTRALAVAVPSEIV